MKTGDIVRFREMPPWVLDLPEESQQVFRACLGKTFKIAGIEANGLVVLDVSEFIDSLFGGYMNDIRVEEIFLVEE